MTPLAVLVDAEEECVGCGITQNMLYMFSSNNIPLATTHTHRGVALIHMDGVHSDDDER